MPGPISAGLNNMPHSAVLKNSGLLNGTSNNLNGRQHCNRTEFRPSSVSHTSNSQEYDEKRVQNRIFVGGLNETIDENDIRQLFSRFGEIKEVALKDRGAKKDETRRGHGFVTFKTRDAAQRAIFEGRGEVLEIKGIKLNVCQAIRRVAKESWGKYDSAASGRSSMSPPLMDHHLGSLQPPYSSLASALNNPPSAYIPGLVHPPSSLSAVDALLTAQAAMQMYGWPYYGQLGGGHPYVPPMLPPISHFPPSPPPPISTPTSSSFRCKYGVDKCSIGGPGWPSSTSSSSWATAGSSLCRCENQQNSNNMMPINNDDNVSVSTTSPEKDDLQFGGLNGSWRNHVGDSYIDMPDEFKIRHNNDGRYSLHSPKSSKSYNKRPREASVISAGLGNGLGLNRGGGFNGGGFSTCSGSHRTAMNGGGGDYNMEDYHHHHHHFGGGGIRPHSRGPMAAPVSAHSVMPIGRF